MHWSDSFCLTYGLPLLQQQGSWISRLMIKQSAVYAVTQRPLLIQFNPRDVKIEEKSVQRRTEFQALKTDNAVPCGALTNSLEAVPLFESQKRQCTGPTETVLFFLIPIKVC